MAFLVQVLNKYNNQQARFGLSSARTLQSEISNSTDCRPSEFGVASDSYVAFGLIYSIFNVVLILSGFIWWHVHRDNLYLKRRNFELVCLMAIGWIANTTCGPLYRSSLSTAGAIRHACFLVNLSYFCVIPFIAWPQYVRLLLFRNRIQFNNRVAELFDLNLIREDDIDAKSTGMSSYTSTIASSNSVRKLKFRASREFGLLLSLGGMAAIFLLAILYSILSCPTALFPNQDCSYAGFNSIYTGLLFAMPLFFCVGMHIYVQRKTMGEPDPFSILYEIKMSYIFPLFIGIPGLFFAVMDPGNIQDQIPLRWKWTLLVDFATTLVFVWTIHYQVYKSIKRKNSTMDKSGLTLEALLKSETGFVLFEQQLVHEFSVDNLTCWKAIRAWKDKHDGRQPFARTKEARKIYNRWIKPGSFLEVNISGKTRSNVGESMNSDGIEDFPKDMFDMVEKELYELMASDSFRRFTHSPLYKQYTGQEEVTLENVSSFIDEPENGSRIRSATSQFEMSL